MLDQLLCDAALEPINGGQSGSQVARVRRPGAPPQILKTLRPDQVPVQLQEMHGAIAAREFRFYTELQPQLQAPAPAIYAAGELADGGSYLLMEDLAADHRLFPADHVWTEAELHQILTAYARFHARSLRLFAEAPVPGWLDADPRAQFNPETVFQCLRDLAANDWTAEPAAKLLAAPGLPALLERVARAMAPQPAALLYNDFYPGNVALPQDGGPAKLFDWQLAGSGPVHVDLTNVGLYGPEPAVDFYLDELARETGTRLDSSTFRSDLALAWVMAWGVFLPAIVRSMRRCNESGRRFSEWMASSYTTCIQVFTDALD